MIKILSKVEKTIKSVLHDDEIVCDWRFCNFYDCEHEDCTKDWMVNESPGKDCPLFGKGATEYTVSIETSVNIPDLYKLVEVLHPCSEQAIIKDFTTEKFPEGFKDLNYYSACGCIEEYRRIYPEKYLYMEPMETK